MPTTTVVMGRGIQHHVERDLDDVLASFYDALETGGWLQITAADGERVAINPAHVWYLFSGSD